MPDTHEYWYDEGAAEWAVSFFQEELHHTKGKWAGQPFALAPWQADDVIRPLFGWKRNDAEQTRRYRRCAIWVPRKNGKTELAAGCGLLLLVGDGEPGCEGYSIAVDEAQASLCFHAAQKMVPYSEFLSDNLECLKTSIYCPDPLIEGSFRPLSGKPQGKHGLNMSFMIGDELHEWPNDRLFQFVHQSSAARLQPLEILISTAGIKGTYAEEFYEYCIKVRDGIIEDPELLVVIYEADPEDDWTDEKTWRKANPNLGVSVQLDYLRTECRAAQESPRLENDFRRYHLNQWTEQAVRWISVERWDACSEAAKDEQLWRALEDELAGRECHSGLDLASVNDIASLVHHFPPKEEGEKHHILCRFFCPEDTIALRTRRDRLNYEEWTAAGALFSTPGNITDYRFIKEQIYRDAEKFLMRGLAIDRWNASQISVELADEGLPVVLFGQGYGSMSAPAKELERLVLGGLIEHGRHPVQRWMVSNVAVKTDPAGNIKPDKEKSSEKIDGVVANIMGLGMSMQPTDPVEPLSPWDLDPEYRMEV